MHKHLTSAAAQEARHEHRLKTTLLPRSGNAARAAQQHHSQAAGSLSHMYLAGDNPELPRASTQVITTVKGSTTVNASASAEFTYKQAWESVDQYYTQQPQQQDGPLRGALAGGVATTRFDVAAAAAVNTSPSKTRSGSAYSGNQQQPISTQQYDAQQQGYVQQLLSQPQRSRKYPDIPGSTAAEAGTGQFGCCAGNAAATAAEAAGGAASQAGLGYAARLFKSTGKAPSRKGSGSSSSSADGSHGRSKTSASTGATAAAAAQTQMAVGASIAAEVGYVQQQQQTAAGAVPPAPSKQRDFSKPEASAAAQPTGQKQQQQQQQQNSQATTSFGVRISGSLVAAINGWLVNQAVDAAAAAATAAIAGSPAAAAAPAAAAGAEAQAKHEKQHDSSKWSIGGFLRNSVSPRQLDQQQQQGSQSLQKSAAAAIDETARTEGSSGGYLNYFGSRRVSRRSSSGSSEDNDGDVVDMQDVELRSSSSSDAGGDADAGLLSDEDVPAAAAATRPRRHKGRLAAAAAKALSAAKGPGDAAAAANAVSDASFVLVGRPAVAKKVKALRGVLLWHSKGASAKALGFGLYIVMLIGSIPAGLEYMQLTTLLPIVALAYLSYNLAKPWAIRASCKVRGSGNAAEYSARLAALESSALDRAVTLCTWATAEAGQWLLAVVALAHRALRGQKFTTTAWTILSLWLLLLVSELRIINQTLLAMLAYGGLFCVPWLYTQFKHHIDTVVYDTIHFLTLLVVHAERWAYAVALLAAGLVWQTMESEGGSVIVQGSAAALAGLAVLVWRVAVADT